jgi:hypothetical protein
LRPRVEELEPRVLLAASPPPGALTPAQIAHAYGFDQLVLPNGQPATGAGLTIAIYTDGLDPGMQSEADLNTFDAFFNIPAPPSFQYVFLPGAPPTMNGDTGELALDVETIHALVPQANLLIIASNTPNNFSAMSVGLFAQYAAQHGASVGSASFGSAEFPGETAIDPLFATPGLNGNGVTFVASTGDNGAPAEYPAVSPNVVAAGGTTLYLDAQGNYLSEAAWSCNGPCGGFGGGAGGISAYEPQPAYQQGIVTQSTTFRTAPDLSLQADSAPGVPVYDSTGGNDWEAFGGTSHAAPALAAMFLMVDQGRVQLGLKTLTSQQMLTGIYDAPASDFHDIVSGYNARYYAGPGYDLTTGRGSPIVPLLVPYLTSFGIQPPVAGAATYQTDEAAALNVSTANGLARFVQANLPGQPTLTFTEVQGPAHGTLMLNSDGSFTYVPTAGFTGTDTFTYQVSTLFGTSNPATVTINVAPLYFAVGAEAGTLPQVNVFDATTGKPVASFFAFDASFRGGVRVAVADMNGDGTPDIICAAGPGGGPQVTVYSGVTFQPILSFFAYPGGFAGGVYVAASTAGDEILVGPGSGGGPELKVFNGLSGALLQDFFAFPAFFAGGVRVALGALDAAGLPSIIVGAGGGGLPEIRVFDGQTLALVQDFMAFPGAFTGGVFVTAGTVNGTPEIIVGAGAGSSQVSIFNATTAVHLASFYALSPAFAGGVRVSFAASFDGGGPALLTGAGPGGAPQLSVFDATTLTLLSSFFALPTPFSGGMYVGS